MNKGFWVLGLAGLLLGGGSEAAPTGIQLDLEHRVVEWGNGAHSVEANGYGEVVLSVEAPPVKGLYPGAVKPMALVVSNTGRKDIRIVGMSGVVARTSRVGCAPVAQNLVVRAWQSPGASAVVVRARSRRAMGALPLYMPPTVANGCQNTTFTIRLTATGSQVER